MLYNFALRYIGVRQTIVWLGVVQQVLCNRCLRKALGIYFARILLFFGLCSNSHSPSASISGGT